MYISTKDLSLDEGMNLCKVSKIPLHVEGSFQKFQESSYPILSNYFESDRVSDEHFLKTLAVSNVVKHLQTLNSTLNRIKLT